MVYLSLCIATNGIEEWVFPVLDSIYSQGEDEALFEVVVTNNGKDENFHRKMTRYASLHGNLVYQKTKEVLFENQICALRLGNGAYLKFVNHRSLLYDGALKWMIHKIKDEYKEKPIMFFSNGVLKLGHEKKCESFDCFVRTLKRYSSWTTGVGVWKEDFEQIPEDHKYNHISPHSDVLFFVKDRDAYIVEDRVWAHDIEANHSKKGKYDLYKTFGCDELAILLNLYIEGFISVETFNTVKLDYEQFFAELYFEFDVLRKPCSYDLSGFEDNVNIFFSKHRVILLVLIVIFKKIVYAMGNKMQKYLNWLQGKESA